MIIVNKIKYYLTSTENVSNNIKFCIKYLLFSDVLV